jgi:hypothetical protein
MPRGEVMCKHCWLEALPSKLIVRILPQLTRLYIDEESGIALPHEVDVSAHHYALVQIKTVKEDDEQVLQVELLYIQKDLTDTSPPDPSPLKVVTDVGLAQDLSNADRVFRDHTLPGVEYRSETLLNYDTE